MEEGKKAGEKKKNEEKKAHAKHKKKKKDTILYWSIALVIAVIILFIAASKYYQKQPDYPVVIYNNWEFTRISDMWWFEWQHNSQVYTIPLRFNPYEAEEVKINGKLNSTAFNSRGYVYITFDLSNESSQDLSMLALASAELTQNIATAIKKTPVAACTNAYNDACDERPVKTCENTDEPVIFLREGGETLITLKGNCIIIEGKGIELVKSVDRLLYHWYRIMQ